MKTKTERLLTVSLVLLLFSVLFSAAFLTSSGTTDNIITFGNLKLELINNTLDEQGKEVAVENEQEKLERSNVSRIVKVKNICEYPMYVRVRIDLIGNDHQTSFDANQYVSLNTKEENWTYRDGWYYFVNILQPEDTTDDLLKGLEFDLDRLGSDHAGAEISMQVLTQAVQSDNNAADVLDVVGWPEEAKTEWNE